MEEGNNNNKLIQWVNSLELALYIKSCQLGDLFSLIQQTMFFPQTPTKK